MEKWLSTAGPRRFVISSKPKDIVAIVDLLIFCLPILQLPKDFWQAEFSNSQLLRLS